MEMYQVILFSGINALLLAMIMIVHNSKGTVQNEEKN